MASQWFCNVLGQQIGPVSFREMAGMVRARTLKEDDPVRREGTSQWIRAREVIGLFRAAAKEPAQARPETKAEPPPVEIPGKPKQAERPPAKPPRLGRRRALLAGGLVVGLVLLVAGVTAWRASRRERFPEPRRTGVRVVQEDLLAPLLAKRASTTSTPVPSDPVPQPAGDDASGLKDRFTLDFREDFETQAVELVLLMRSGTDKTTRPSPVEQFSVEPAGVRVTIPNGSTAGYCAGDLRILLRGDFQVTARYTILNLQQPEGGHGTGVGISVQETGGERAALERKIGMPNRHAFLGVRGERQEKGGYRYRVQSHDTSSEALSGWMRLVRMGSRIRYQIAGPHTERFVQIHEADFPSGEVIKVLFKAQTGGSPTAVDVVWSYYDVQAEQIVKEYAPAKGS